MTLHKSYRPILDMLASGMSISDVASYYKVSCENISKKIRNIKKYNRVNTTYQVMYLYGQSNQINK